ncbi:MAG: type II toxin-antitoxin system Phd/YefM family antitoxin [gamma proteobacterium symbiont of Taylorina sp.]|nr:type II toxin-antitoxin system Phd/YefM family antitoxin [gamma proteobacterium symbiont of Taylorina sp.]
MRAYSYTEVRQNLASVLDEANEKGVVQINRRDGQSFLLKPIPTKGSPLDIKGIYVNISTQEIIDIIREGRDRDNY